MLEGKITHCISGSLEGVSTIFLLLDIIQIRIYSLIAFVSARLSQFSLGSVSIQVASNPHNKKSGSEDSVLLSTLMF